MKGCFNRCLCSCCELVGVAVKRYGFTADRFIGTIAIPLHQNQLLFPLRTVLLVSQDKDKDKPAKCKVTLGHREPELPSPHSVTG